MADPAQKLHADLAVAPRAPRSRIYDGAIYGWLLDPFNANLHGFVAAQIEPGARVLEVGCGTGVLALRLGQKAKEVVGVELSPAMVAYANRRLAAARAPNVSFVLGDAATALSGQANASFDVATMVLVLHEMPAEARPEVLREATRLARRVLCFDYTVPLPRSPTGLLYRGLELAAGLEHFHGFQDFTARGGTESIAANAELEYRRLRTIAGGCIEVSELCRCPIERIPAAPTPGQPGGARPRTAGSSRRELRFKPWRVHLFCRCGPLGRQSRCWCTW